IFDLVNLKDYKKYISNLFTEYNWIEKIIIMNNKNINGDKEEIYMVVYKKVINKPLDFNVKEKN
ncbi:hypothetical protein ABGF38_04105, partial [Helcococcus ovis]